jgi:hypothetical protein
MENNSLLLIDPNFTEEASINHNLLLKVTNDSISYAVVNKNTEKVSLIFDQQATESVAKNLKKAFKEDKYLSLNYNAVKIAVHTDKFIFIPDEWLHNDLSVYAKYLNTEQEIESNNNKNLGLNTLFALKSDIKEILPSHANVFAQSEPLFALTKNLSDQALLLDFTATSFNALYLKDNKVNFQNHYQIDNEEEFNYYLLLIIEQLSLNENIPVYIQGIIHEDDEYYNCILKYFNQIFFFLPIQKTENPLLADMPMHYFSGLLALNLCE